MDIVVPFSFHSILLIADAELPLFILTKQTAKTEQKKRSCLKCWFFFWLAWQEETKTDLKQTRKRFTNLPINPLWFYNNDNLIVIIMGASHSKVEDSDRVLVAGRPNYNRCDNVIVTSKYTVWSFLPVVRLYLFVTACVPCAREYIYIYIYGCVCAWVVVCVCVCCRRPSYGAV